MPLDNPFKKLSKPQIYAVIGGTVLIGGVYEYKHHESTGSWNPFSKAAASATGSAIDPVTNLPVSEDTQIDPITNLPYLAEAQQYGSVSAAEAAVSSFGTTVNSGTGTSTAFGTSSDGGSALAAGAVSSSVYTSNAAWAQAATAGLADIGYSQTDIATALGDYLTGTPVTATQAGYIQTAIAEFGPPPIGSFQVIQAPITTPSKTTTGTAPSTPGTPAKTPSSTPPPKPVKPAMPGGVTANGVSPTGFTLSWHPVSGATEYNVRVTYQSTVVYQGSTSGTSKGIGGLTPDHTYTVHVSASNSAGASSETNGPSVKTSK